MFKSTPRSSGLATSFVREVRYMNRLPEGGCGGEGGGRRRVVQQKTTAACYLIVSAPLFHGRESIALRRNEIKGINMERKRRERRTGCRIGNSGTGWCLVLLFGNILASPRRRADRWYLANTLLAGVGTVCMYVCVLDAVFCSNLRVVVVVVVSF